MFCILLKILHQKEKYNMVITFPKVPKLWSCLKRKILSPQKVISIYKAHITSCCTMCCLNILFCDASDNMHSSIHVLAFTKTMGWNYVLRFYFKRHRKTYLRFAGRWFQSIAAVTTEEWSRSCFSWDQRTVSSNYEGDLKHLSG